MTGIDRRARQDRYTPGRTRADILADRRALFDGLNKFVMAQGGWITSIPGAQLVTFEVPEGSTLPDELIELGYSIGPADPPEGQRILPTAIETKFTTNADGSLGPLTEGSTQAVTTIVRHAGIERVLRYSFTME